MILHNASLRVEFNPNNLREVDEAKRKYLDAKKAHRVILNIDRKPLGTFAGALVDGGFIIDETQTTQDEIAMHFIDGTGDRRIIWNLNDPEQLKEAETEFKKYVAKGWKPYAINKDGKKGMRIFSFDAAREEIIFEDKTTVEKLKDFAKKFKEVKMIPKTYPG